ncbi:MAG: hypothetical protein GY715_08495 [Planctomycetes bacterium]|nr:hypothetical protein [Planctomycetota bacterium]
MDRERLKEVHQTDLTESKVNEDFVDWLKTKAPTWLLVFLVAVCVYLGLVRFKQHRSDYRSEAWAEFSAAELPGTFDDIANEYGDVGELALLARLEAADTLMRSVQNGLVLGVTPPAPPGPGQPPTAVPADSILAAEQRTEYLDRAEGFYDQVLATGDEPEMTVYVVGAMTGKAAIAECRGDAGQAIEWYGKAEQRAEATYPGLAETARRRAADAERNSRAVAFPTNAEAGARRASAEKLTPIEIDEALKPFLLPDEEDAEQPGTSG